MSRKIGITEARDSLSEVLNRVAYGGERYVIERRGKPLAAMISAVEFRRWTMVSRKELISPATKTMLARINTVQAVRIWMDTSFCLIGRSLMDFILPVPLV